MRSLHWIGLVLLLSTSQALISEDIVCDSSLYASFQPLKNYRPAKDFCAARFPSEPVEYVEKRGYTQCRLAGTNMGSPTDKKADLMSSLSVAEIDVAKTICSCLQNPWTAAITTMTTTATTTSTSAAMTTTTTKKATSPDDVNICADGTPPSKTYDNGNGKIMGFCQFSKFPLVTDQVLSARAINDNIYPAESISTACADVCARDPPCGAATFVVGQAGKCYYHVSRANDVELSDGTISSWIWVGGKSGQQQR